jgi:hypothetical protein
MGAELDEKRGKTNITTPVQDSGMNDYVLLAMKQ